ncbi:probable serine/threonine-protein kinase PBL28 isoform X1 [Pistacia vera]|uniref:probable serine/threonine-protein kinase PBL28 isoform X1 n=2 Tax=Pistacia vera TaxID=55513 RepID=UPI0012639D77|nr:probable serine/threonine-protein kinase PBL28 isoform X1 [Pistacia vera]XP_031247354.1 probable serine/threonine-protein kinase PBL28 isoform X1 [Pistacia vera]XP_031247355.1 probable serine/threonine-protein kinase PBL28 isoform X1 [Pistacia vera]XP_031247356.1 probable serine/threonine-protein kinase PBL28 isoform X1 [Pistacia vera]
MRLFWWQQLPLLILIQLLEPSSINHKIYAEALLACKSALDSPGQSSDKIERYPCIRQRACLSCYVAKDTGFLKSVHSRNRRMAASFDGNSGVPTLTPLQQNDVKKPRKQRVAAIVGGVGAALLVVGFMVLVYVCLMRVKRSIRQTSDAETSVPSPSAELDRTYPYAGDGTQNLRQLAVLELKHATNNFSDSNIIGEGSFGLVYMGLLQDGSMVTIKRHLHTPAQNFVHEVKHIARVHHRHLVRLVGYCEENHQQFLVYDYISNGNVGNFLYDSEGLPIGKLNMRQRLLIAIGAAKGLEHLHSLVPPLFHMHFRTRNVLLDENFTAKISDYGLSKLLIEDPRVGSSSAIDCFLDPELNRSNHFSAGSDVYSFGVFLLELTSGHEANSRNQSNADQNLVLQAKRSSDVGDYVDKTIGNQTVDTAKEMIELALQCVDVSERRPSMRHIVMELEGIQEREISGLRSEIGAVTLGSELFT